MDQGGIEPETGGGGGGGGGLNNLYFSIFSAQIIEKINVSAFEPLTLLTQGETSAS